MESQQQAGRALGSLENLYFAEIAKEFDWISLDDVALRLGVKERYPATFSRLIAKRLRDDGHIEMMTEIQRVRVRRKRK